MELGIVIASGLIFGFISAMVWSGKGGHFGIGFLIGFLLGLIGLIIVAVAKPSGQKSKTLRECPFCKTRMERDASVCPHCQRESEPWTFHHGEWWVTRPSGQYYLDEKTNEWVLGADGPPAGEPAPPPQTTPTSETPSTPET